MADAGKRISKTKDAWFQDRCEYYMYQKAAAVFAQETPDADDLLLAKALWAGQVNRQDIARIVVTNASIGAAIDAGTAGSKLYIFYSNEQASDKSILYLTEDQGETWTTTEINTSPYSYFNYIALFAYEDVVCFVGRTENGSIYVHRSIDKGVSWTTIGTLKTVSYPYTTDWPDYVSNYSTYVTFSQDGPCFTYTSCGSYFKSTGALAFFTSMDAGLTWEVKQSGLPNESGVPTITEKLE